MATLDESAGGVFSFATSLLFFGISAMWTAGHEMWGPPCVAIGIFFLIVSACLFLSPILRKHVSIKSTSSITTPQIIIPHEKPAAPWNNRRAIVYLPEQLSRKNAVIVAILVLISYLSYYFYQNLLVPNVIVEFYNPQRPSLLLKNISKATAVDVHLAVTFWDADDLENAAYPIAVNFPMGFIRPSSGDETLVEFFSPYAGRFKPGDRIVGSVGVVCPNCVGHTIVFAIAWGGGGWYADLPKAGNGEILLPSAKSGSDEIKRFIQTLVSLPTLKDPNKQLKPIVEYAPVH